MERDPYGGLAVDRDGTFYGTTQLGGSGYGTVFSLTPPTSAGGAWTESILWKFDDGSAGYDPRGGLVIEGGCLYGTTSYGDPDSGSLGGAVFVVTP